MPLLRQRGMYEEREEHGKDSRAKAAVAGTLHTSQEASFPNPRGELAHVAESPGRCKSYERLP